MVKGPGGLLRTLWSAGAAALGLVLICAPAAAEENSIVGAMQRFVNSLPFAGSLISKPAPAPGANAAPASGAGRPLPGGQSLLPPPPIPPASIPTAPASLAAVPPPPAAAATAPQPNPVVAASPASVAHVALGLSARYGRDGGQPINGGIVWRIYPSKPDPAGVFRPVREERTPSPLLMLPPGDYVVHASFGLTSAARTVRLRSEPAREVFELPAGGIRLEGRVGDVPIPAGQISFDLFNGSQFEVGEKTQIAQGVMTGDVVVVPEGTYHIVSTYGDTNAVVRSDIRVQAGKLTDITVTHRAAVIMLKLVGEPGGEARANTTWTVLTPGGDVIKETVGAFPKVVLAEGEYRAIARNEGKTFERDFNVTNGVDGEVELLAR